MEGIDDAFLSYACSALADTNKGLSGNDIVKYCSKYAVQFSRSIPYSCYPFSPRNTNKRTALKQNLSFFSKDEQFLIIKYLCELEQFYGNEEVQTIKNSLISRYGYLAKEKLSDKELVQDTKHWLSDYPDALKQYENALLKYENGVFERNTLDDIRLSLELLVKRILNNNRSLENQISEISKMLKASGISVELNNMFPKMIEYYTIYQNNHVKHNDKVNENEIEYIIELTSVMMRFLIKVHNL